MHWGLCYIIQGIKPKTFEELTTYAYDIKLSIANVGTQAFPINNSKKRKEK